MVGQYIIHILFGIAVGITVSYFMAMKGKTGLLAPARILYYLFAVGLGAVTVLLMNNVLTHQFQYAYVHGYSSKDLGSPFIYAAFYAGQEGSFTLWTIFTTVIGLFLLPYVKKRGYEQPVMFFYGLILVFLMLMLVAKNPFAFLWETMAKQGITQERVTGLMNDGTLNGKGLNPVLQNRWIMIHPPILFLGFAAMAVPFVMSMAGLVKREFQEWIRIAFPWALFACAVLGFGIMLGGFWAYVTLGWGGFWAWDPVENSSLIPWLVCVALVHTMYVQRKTKGFVKTNILLSVLTFVAVMLSTFLTRSGILGETSVHSFVEPGMYVYNMLLFFLIFFFVLGVSLIAIYYKDIKKFNEKFEYTSREFTLGIGSAVLLASAVIVTLGTCYPAIAELIGQQKIAIQQSFYNTMHIPIMIALFLVNVFSMAMSWKRTNKEQLIKRIKWSVIISLLTTIATYFLGVHNAEYLALVFFSWMALVINVDMAVTILRKTPVKSGAYISHAGVALLMLGIVATAGYTETSHARLKFNTPTNVLGYSLTYKGRDRVEKEFKDREKYEYYVEVEKNGQRLLAKPIWYWSDFNQRKEPMAEPGIAWTPKSDLYVSPKQVIYEGEAPKVKLMKEQTSVFPTDSTVSFTMQRFDMSEARNSDMEGYLKMAAIVTVHTPTGDVEKKLYTYFNGTEFLPIETKIPNTNKRLSLIEVKRNQQEPDKSTATFACIDEAKPETIPVEVFVADISVKPFINLVWIGVITMVFGFFIAIFKHLGESVKKQEVTNPDSVSEDLITSENSLPTPVV
ncbi:MAG: cytochrome c biogenesis protein CcsA [Candidatus Kapabacteria bacterium]|nr:cytochrome c biogenesis protein CcsA [Candidatus Kapabacteria bacterium]